jgi:hypothetical protein
MAIITKVLVGGSAYDNHTGAVVERATNDYDSSSFFEVELPNPYGRYSNKFSVGQDVLIHAAKDVGAYYSFENNVEDTFRDKDGSASGLTYSTGKYGTGGVFDGTTSQVTLPASNTIITNNNTWSISCWYKPSNVTGTRYIAVLCTSSLGTVAAGLRTSNVLAQFVYNAGAGAVAVNIGAVSIGTWVHLALTYDGTQYRCYYNGMEQTGATAAFTGFGTAAGYIGGLNAASGAGTIDEVGFYNYVLTDADVLQQYGDPGWPGKPFFGGYLEDKEFRGPSDAPNESLRLSGRSYISILHDASVQPITYSNQDISAIVIDLCSREAPDIDTSEVATTGVVLDTWGTSHVSLYDALKQLAELADAYFYLSPAKVLSFKKMLSTASNLSLRAGVNITESYVTESRKPMYNKVWVYGDKQLVDAGDLTFTANGGSVYTLNYAPHNVGVFVAGSTVSKQGGILNFVGQGDPGSGTQFLVDYNNKQIVFVSGTLAGDNIPTSGSTSFVVKYQRQRQIIKYAQDDTSISSYKPKTYAYIDKNIKDPLQASSIALALLDKNAHPFKEINTKFLGWADVVPGQTAGVYEPYQEVSGAQFSIIRAKYEFAPANLQTEEIVNLTLNRKMVDGADIIKQALLDIKRIRAQETVEGELYTRLQIGTGSAGLRVDAWSVSTGGLGSSFVLGHPTLGVLGTTVPQPYLGDSRPAKTIQYSGADA